MLENGAFGVYPRAEGVVFSGVHYDRASCLIAGGEGALRAGIGGVSIGRFGWADANGNVLNQRLSASDLIGLVVTQRGDWRRVFWDDLTQSWKIRAGMNLTMLTGAKAATVRLSSFAPWNTQIYTDPVDGQPIAGYAAGLEPTRWRLVNPNAGGLSLITTWNNPP